MLPKNKETIERTIVGLQSMLETDKSISYYNSRSIQMAMFHLRDIVGDRSLDEVESEIPDNYATG